MDVEPGLGSVDGRGDERVDVVGVGAGGADGWPVVEVDTDNRVDTWALARLVLGRVECDDP